VKYYVIESIFHDPVPVDKTKLDELIQEHKVYLQKGFNEGWILLSGPKALVAGGIIIMKASSLNEVENYFSEDPLKIAGVQEYRPIEFKLHDAQPMLKDWF
jgi:uncharacterized protein YciI